MDDFKGYKILEDLGLILEVYVGGYDVNDVISLKKKLFNDEKYKPNFNIITDLRFAFWNIDKLAISKYINFAANNKNSIKERKVAFLTSKPNEVVIGILFSKMNDKLPITLEVFSTYNAAFSFLGIQNEVDRDKIIEVFDTLKK